MNYADGRLYLLGKDNLVELTQASPAEYSQPAGSTRATRVGQVGRHAVAEARCLSVKSDKSDIEYGGTFDKPGRAER